MVRHFWWSGGRRKERGILLVEVEGLLIEQVQRGHGFTGYGGI